MSFSVMTYNIRVGVGAEGSFAGSHPYNGLQRVAELILSFDPDIVALQEVDRFQARTGRVDQAAWLADALGMHFAHSPSYLAEPVPQGGRARYGNAILSKQPIVWSEAIHLFHRGWLLPGEANWVNEPRSMLEAATTVEGRAVRAYSLHLSTTPDQQAYQIEQVVKALRQGTGPQIIMGDFNTSLDFTPMKLLADGWVSALKAVGIDPATALTYPWGSRATIPIDHIFVNPDISVLEATVIVDDEGVSDHNPVIAHLEFNS